MSNPAIKTAAGHEFRRTGDASTPHRGLFTVAAGVPLLDALQSVSDLLSTIGAPIHDAAMSIRPLKDNDAWLVDHTLECAKAVIDSLIDSLEYPDSPADQRATE